MKDITESGLSDDKEFLWMPEDMKRDLGLFNVFNLIPEMVEQAESPTYHRKDYCKISLIEGSGSFVHGGEEISIATKFYCLLD